MKTILSGTLALGILALSVGAAAAGTAWTSQQTALNARSGPGTSYHVLRSFKRCTKVHVIKYSHGWAKISYGGKHYWVSSKYLRGKPCGQVRHHGQSTHHKYHSHKHRHGHKHHTHKHRVNVGHH